MTTLLVANRAAPGVRGGFFESRVAGQENEIHGAGWAVALLGDDQLGFGAIFFGHIRFVKIRAIDKEDHIRVLLDCAGLAKVG